MAAYKYPLDTVVPAFHQSLRNNLMRTARPHLHRITKTTSPQTTRNMSLLFPRFAFAPARCGPVRHEVAPLFSLFDDTFAELQRASRQSRKHWNPRFDVKETKESYQVDAEIPGVDPKDVSVEFIDEHTISIKGRSERVTERGNKPQAVEAAPAAQEGTATPASETASVKSHQATVEDEEPANGSAAQESSEVAKTTGAEKTQEVAKTEEQQQQPQEQYWFSERHTGSFQRQFAFPARVNQDQVKASLKNGLLSIIVPKAPAPESRRIAVE
jgi:HSP20 family protein